MEFFHIFSMYWFQILLVLLISYLLGSLNFSIIVVNFFKKGNIKDGQKLDIRHEGSGNAGFTNVLRSIGIKSAVFTFIGDFTKGYLSVFLTKIIFLQVPAFRDVPTNLESIMFASLFVCTIGHIYPCFFGFKGGKGILTAWAAMLPINIWLFVTLIAIFLVVLCVSKIVSLASIVVTIVFPILNAFIKFFSNQNIFGSFSYSIFVIFLPFLTSIFVLFRHRENFMRILSGTEGQIHRKRK